MKVAIVAPSPVPFTRGGAERAWSGLHAALLDAGHDAEVVKLPVAERTLAQLGRGYRAFAELDVTHFDAVVTSKYPAWICPHPHHVLWMFHPLRGLYDTYHLFDLPLVPGEVQPPTAALLDAVGGPARRDRVAEVLDALDAAVAGLGEDHPDLSLPGPVSRAVVQWLDRVALAPGEISRHTALSRTVAARPGYLPEGVRVRVAYAPSDLVDPDRAEESLDRAVDDGAVPTLFTTSRIDGPKRLDLLVRAMAHVPGDVRLLIGGTGPDEARVRALAAADPRIRLLGFVPDEELVRRYAGARAVPFVPLDEDYGLITVEAMALGSPVVTCTDSGGAAELVRDGVDGLVVPPTPEALGRALADLVADPARAARLGDAARARAARITWPAVVRTLLGPDAQAGPPTVAPGPTATAPPATPARTTAPGSTAPPRSGPRRPKAVVLTTFRVADRGHGGQLRSFHLYGAAARHLDVEVVSLTDGGPAGSTRLAPGLVETAVPISDEHRRAAEEQTLAAGVPVSDVVAGTEIARTPEYLRRLRAAGHGADVVVLAEPYLLPALDEAGMDLPVVYDAFNVEAALKSEVLPPGPRRAQVLAQVVAVEEAASRRAAVITACSAEDAAALTAAVGRPRGDAVVVPNGTDTAAIEVPSAEQRRRRAARWLARHREVSGATGLEALALFLGSWHPPNLVAANIVLEVAPDVPEVLFVMGGRHGDAFAHHVVPPNVVFVGVVSTTAKATLLGTAHVAVNPMATGSGTNLKLIEYLAAGTPVVTSTTGARGVDVVDGEHLLVSDDLEQGVGAVLADPDAAARRAATGRALVEARYDWSALGDRMAEVVLSAARA